MSAAPTSGGLGAVILAAGLGTRLKSRLPKMLHPLGGRPLVTYAVAAAAAVSGRPPVLVVGHGGDAVRAALGAAAVYVEQAAPLGTGHAAQQAAAALRGAAELVLVTYGDMPLLTAVTLQALVAVQRANPGPFSLLSVDAPPLRDFGRIVRDAAGELLAVVEAHQATAAEYALTEVNVGAYCFRGGWLWEHLPRLPLSPKGEYYLTDLVGLAVAAGERVAVVQTDDPAEAIGINNRAQLAEAEAALRRRTNTHWMLAGVTLADPASTYIEPGVTLQPDTVILPNTHLQGATTVGAECVLGPNTIIRDSVIGDRCRVEASVVEGAALAEDVSVGPFAHLRKGARLERGAHMGNFGEVKNSTLGPGVKMGHFSYVGDATIAAEVNIGAGTITCNFDGVKKNPTVIGAGAFIGSDTLLVAPVSIGAGARTGAGAVVTKDVPPDTLAVGVPARAIRKLKQAGS
ncbi:MAG: bifunctional UDP-N-acetylglucosamine diphosphorylase/glucosamine-1-phosphate N-acetyltransferase GlmU [Anaerolineales bacterium]|nr:bifunctional UDP-N-acetylglucosamine diphosphorylase/glucosamine-1-phosphate N-acetyltransferase GlmU [Anaerolineales bacterium]